MITTEFESRVESILRSKCGTQVDTGEGIPLIVNSRSWPVGTTIEQVNAGDPAAEVTLTEDGRGYDRTGGWHGPLCGEIIFVERWTAERPVFHGWIDKVSRRLVQSG